jgi:hypothetical protein
MRIDYAPEDESTAFRKSTIISRSPHGQQVDNNGSPNLRRRGSGRNPQSAAVVSELYIMNGAMTEPRQMFHRKSDVYDSRNDRRMSYGNSPAQEFRKGQISSPRGSRDLVVREGTDAGFNDDWTRGNSSRLTQRVFLDENNDSGYRETRKSITYVDREHVSALDVDQDDVLPRNNRKRHSLILPSGRGGSSSASPAGSRFSQPQKNNRMMVIFIL